MMAAHRLTPLVTKQHLDKVHSYIDASVDEGAKVVVDGRRDFRHRATKWRDARCLAALSLTGCEMDSASLSQQLASADALDRQKRRAPPMYRAVVDGDFTIPKVNPDEVDARFWRAEVPYDRPPRRALSS